MLKSLEGSCFRQKIDLEPLIISPTTNFSLHPLTLSFKMSFSLSDSVISFQANFQIQIQKKRRKSYFSLNNLKTKVSLETVSSDGIVPFSEELLWHGGCSTMTEWYSPLDASVEQARSKPPALVWNRGPPQRKIGMMTKY